MYTKITQTTTALVLSFLMLIATASAQELRPDISQLVQSESTVTLTSSEIDLQIESLANGKKTVDLIRVFSNYSEVGNNDLAFGYVRGNGTFDPLRGSIICFGYIGGNTVLEEIRFVEVDERQTTFVLRDIYLDGEKSDLGKGRETPFTLPSDEQGPENAISSAPRIDRIGGSTSTAAGISDGVVNMPVGYGTNWNGHRVINNERGMYRWKVYGSNFGSTPGTFRIAGQSAVIVSWSNTTIEIDPVLPYNASPLCALLELRTSTGTTIQSAANIVPSIKSRIYGQCTFEVAYTRLLNGRTPSPMAYSTNGTINGSYVPSRFDQYYTVGMGHTMIVTGVSGGTLTSNGTRTWSLTIRERNAKGNNELNVYTTTFQTRNGTVIIYPKSSSGRTLHTSFWR